MPQMPDAAQQMLERVRRSFDAYLNPTGDVRAEDVPFIDLGQNNYVLISPGYSGFS